MKTNKREAFLRRLAVDLKLSSNDLKRMVVLYKEAMTESLQHGFLIGDDLEENLMRRQRWSSGQVAKEMGQKKEIISFFLDSIQKSELRKQARYHELLQELRNAKITSQELSRIVKEEGLA